MRLFEFWASHRDEVMRLAGEHVFLVAISTIVAIAIGLPVGIFAARRPRAGRPIVALANIVQTIPSLALLGFLIPLPFVGLGTRGGDGRAHSVCASPDRADDRRGAGKCGPGSP